MMSVEDRVLGFEEGRTLKNDALWRAVAGVVFLVLMWDASQREWEGHVPVDTLDGLEIERWPVYVSDWVEIPLGEKDEAFVADFPGQVRQFQGDGESFILRRVDRPTRKLHPAADCFKAMGYVAMPEPAYKDLTGSLWRQTRVEKNGVRLAVYERIVSRDGSEWMDVSKWYWQSLFGKSAGPWYAVTRVKPI